MIEKVLYATRIGAEDWEEELITTDPDAIQPATEWALSNGFDRIRVANIDLSVKPDFSTTINK